GAVEEIEGDDEEGNKEGGNEGVGGFTDIYRNMSQGDWQDKRAHWMYDHTVRQFQHMSTHDSLESHLHIDPFPGFEADYPPYGYQGHMPTGYRYRPYPPHDGSS
nr:hypothetical protein [Tanacetum cinerariifolium]